LAQEASAKASAQAALAEAQAQARWEAFAERQQSLAEPLSERVLAALRVYGRFSALDIHREVQKEARAEKKERQKRSARERKEARAAAKAARAVANAAKAAARAAAAQGKAKAKAERRRRRRVALEQEALNIAALVTMTLQIQGMLVACRWSLLHSGSLRWREISEGWLKRVRTFVSEGSPVNHFACIDIEGRDGYEPYAVSISAVGVGGLTWTWALNPFPEGVQATLEQCQVSFFARALSLSLSLFVCVPSMAACEVYPARFILAACEVYPCEVYPKP
jgi:hypothetical protein